MGKGGSSSSSNTTNTKNTSGQNAIQGDNLGVALSGVSDSEINVSMSDHGAIEAAKEMGELAMNNNADVTKTALDMGQTVAKDAIDLSRETSEVISNSHSESLQYVAGLAGSSAKQNAENLQTIKALADSTSNGGASASNSAMTKVVGLVIAGAVVVSVAKAVSG